MGSIRRRAVRSLRRVLNAAGIEALRYSPENFAHLRRAPLIGERRIDVVVDVGANAGQYARELRRAGYRGRILSFEPASAPFAKLRTGSEGDPLWEALPYALGADDRNDAAIGIAANDGKSSSLLPMTPRHLAAVPDAPIVGTERVAMARLDTLAPTLFRREDRLLLKLDVQGAELEVLQGAEASLEQVEVVEAELTLVPLYEGQALIHEVLAFLYERHFDLVAFESTLRDRATGDLLQANGLLARRAG